jgi:hypothetical protein
MNRSITLSQAQAVENYGLEVNLLSPASLDSYQLLMSREGASVVNSGHVREDAEVIL